MRRRPVRALDLVWALGAVVAAVVLVRSLILWFSAAYVAATEGRVGEAGFRLLLLPAVPALVWWFGVEAWHRSVGGRLPRRAAKAQGVRQVR
jgi:hypothetical protein